MSMEQAKIQALALAVRIVDSVSAGTTPREDNVANLAHSFMEVYKLGVSDQPSILSQLKSLIGNPEFTKMAKSKTLWSIVMTSVATIAPKVGLHLHWLSPDSAADKAVEVASEVIQAAGLVGAAYGRLVAKEHLTS